MSRQRLSSGASGLDEVLEGGYIKNRSYMLKGGPGTGKTTFGLHFLTANPEDQALFITLDESADQIREDARHMGFDLSGVEFLDLSPDTDFFSEEEDYDLYESADIEWGPVTREIKQAVDDIQPDRVFIDAITQLRHLSPDIYQFRKQVLSFIRYIVSNEATVLIVSEEQAQQDETDDLQYLCDGAIELTYGEVRRLRVSKFRGSDFHGGTHHFVIRGDGLEVFSDQLPGVQSDPGQVNQFSSGIDEFDDMLHGGVEGGTVTLISGPTGVGKTTTGLQFAKQVASTDHRSLIYTFEETELTLSRRCENLNIPINRLRDAGNLEVEYVQQGEYTSKQFSQHVRSSVDQRGSSMVMLDSLSGYKSSFDSEDPAREIRKLLSHFRNRGITVLLIDEVSQITGDFAVSDEKISHLADNIIFLRYVEYRGELRKIIGVLKKRMSDFERTLREIKLTDDGMRVGEPQNHLRGVLSGMPEWSEAAESPMDGVPESALLNG